jgi:hypothetical protein
MQIKCHNKDKIKKVRVCVYIYIYIDRSMCVLTANNYTRNLSTHKLIYPFDNHLLWKVARACC